MTLFITSSPFLEGADRALLSSANGFLDRIRQALPPTPRALFVCSDPNDHEMTCQFGAETMAEALCAQMAQAGNTVEAGRK